jgi:arginine repressor
MQAEKSKSERQAAIKALVSAARISNQERLASLLKDKGFAFTQATLSRDLKELHIVKVPTEDGYVYRIQPHAMTVSRPKAVPTILDGISSIEFSHSMAVLKTIPGYASLVASTIDQRVKSAYIMGTVAGDDTLILALRDNFTQEAVMRDLSEYIPGIEDKQLTKSFLIEVASTGHIKYIPEILKTIEDAAKVRGTGIAKRDPEYIERKMREGKAIIALFRDEFAGFCYIESWGHGKFVANSGLIVKEKFRGKGLAKDIKHKAFELSREKFPKARIFGLTTGLAVMKINTELGYVPVTFSELTDDPEFWKGCENCVNFDVLQRNNYTRCLCTGMLYDPEKHRVK